MGLYTPINDTGTVAFSATLDTGGSGVFAGDGGTPIPIVDLSGVAGAIPEAHSININGLVSVRVTVGRFDFRILVSDGGPPVTIADSSGPFTAFSGPILNNAGTAVFKAFLDTGEEGIFTWNNGVMNTLVDRNGLFSGEFSPPSINNHGVVVFGARLDAGGMGIFTWNNGTISTIADTSGFFEGFGVAHINDTGTVAFGAARGGIVGIYTGPDPVADKVIAEGDPLFGSQVVDIDIWKGLNNAGQIAFYAMLADGRQAIVRANPVPAVVEVTIDIIPGSFPNSINPRSNAPIPVAILSDAFDATTVDPSTVHFGATGTEAAPTRFSLEDVNRDGRADLLLQFRTRDTNIACGDTSASLTGETSDGQAIEGIDVIQTVGCK